MMTRFIVRAFVGASSRRDDKLAGIDAETDRREDAAPTGLEQS